MNDCLNYVPQSKLKTAFSRVAASLKKGGVFVFDVSSETKLREIVGNNLFGEDREEITYLWFNKLGEDSVTMDLTIFERRQDGTYARYDERHVQYIHSEEGIIGALSGAGFSVRTEGHLGQEKRERINFICKRL